MKRFQKAVFSALLACCAAAVGTAVEAGVHVSVTEAKNPPGIPFTTDVAYNSAPLSDVWKSYVVGLSTDDRDKIEAIDVAFSGLFNQRWNVNTDDESPTSTPTPTNVNVTTADSHLMLPQDAVIFEPTMENNNRPSSLPIAADTVTNDYGVGTFLQGIWGYPGAIQQSSINIAYLVVPKDLNPSDYHLHITAYVAQGDPFIFELDNTALHNNPFCPGPFCIFNDDTPPVVDDLTVRRDSTLFPPHTPPIMTATLPVSDDRPIDELIWNLESFTGPRPTNHPPTVDAHTGQFLWDFSDATLGGNYVAVLRATDLGGRSDTGTLTILPEPEPSSFALAGIGLAGAFGLIRRRKAPKRSALGGPGIGRHRSIW